MSKEDRIIVVGGLIKKNDRYLITRRKSGHLSGFWEFPGVKLKK